MPWPLDHFDAEGWLKKRRADCEGLLLDSFRDSIDVEIESLAEAAQLFFRGLYPVESPYLAWGEVKVLPWSDAYSRSEDEAAPPISISTELDRIAHELLQAASGPGRPSMLTYMCASLTTTQLKTQGLAVELLLTLDDLINHLDRAQYLEAVLLMSESHKYVSEMTIQAERLLAPTMALRGADARHKKTRELKSWVIDEFKRGSFASKHNASHALVDAAIEKARALGTRLSPQRAQKTIYDWLRE